MITDVEDFFTRGCGRCDRFDTPECVTRQWAVGLDGLRRICRDAGLSETVKWGHPCYMRGDRNIALIGALRGDFRLSFFNPALMTDPQGLLEPNGPNTRHAGMMRFTDTAQVAAREKAIAAYLAEAIGYADAGIKPVKEAIEIALPDELVEALDADADMAEAFHGLTPGRQRSYVINLNGAKKSETRVSRIAGFRDRILAGKGAMER